MIEFKCQDCYWRNLNGQDTYQCCNLGRLEKLAQNGAEIDFSQSCPVIKGRVCNAYRNKDWAKDKNKYNLELILRAENLVRTDVIIYIEKYNHLDLAKTIESLRNQVLKPLAVRIICNCKPEKAKLIRLMDESGLCFFITESRDIPKTKNEWIDYVIQKSNAAYYQLLLPGQVLHSDWLADIDEAINDKLKRFLYVEGDETKGDLVSVTAHLNFYGNEPCQNTLFKHVPEYELDVEHIRLNNIKEKLEYAGKLHNNNYYIVKPDYILS